MKLTIAISSANNIGLTEDCLQTIPKGYSVIVYDDSSTEPVEEMCKGFGVPFRGRSSPKGLTNLWNEAFSDFLKTDSDILMITNNDLLFSKGSIEQMVEAFSREKPVMLGPLSNRPGACPDGGQYQEIQRYLPKEFPDCNNPGNLQAIQDYLVKTIPNEKRTMVDKYLCGFCFMVDKRLNEIRYDAEHWLDPRNINVGNETWLCAEICKKNGVSNSAGQIGPTLIWGDMMVCRTSFVFHYQGQTTRWCHGKKHSPTSLRPENTRENLWRNA